MSAQYPNALKLLVIFAFPVILPLFFEEKKVCLSERHGVCVSPFQLLMNQLTE
jgi:hypothetical protein